VSYGGAGARKVAGGVVAAAATTEDRPEIYESPCQRLHGLRFAAPSAARDVLKMAAAALRCAPPMKKMLARFLLAPAASLPPFAYR